jgi:molybdopterin synthase sulfur carrier subunit
MATFVRIPQPLRRFTSNQELIEVSAPTIQAALESLEAQFPEIGERLRDGQGQLRRFVNIYVDGEDIRFLKGLATEIKDGAEVSIIPAIAGGCC